MRRWTGIGFLIMLLSACKTDLYSNLQEAEANQMLALLKLRNIDAEKKLLKDGNVTIRVDSDQFVNAVELMRQNGLPRRQVITMEDLFPSGQLVTSPTQEQAKIMYIKEQQLEQMLRSMDGIINAQVSIADEGLKNGREPPRRSASVLVKYSPEHNFHAKETEIRSLTVNGIPNLSPDRVSVVLQAADYRYLPSEASHIGDQTEKSGGSLAWIQEHRLRLAIALGALASLAGLGCAALAWRNHFRTKREKAS
ncbi:type III secretion system inner membrane ring lipoprotein SctJ [Burkholderia ubonensis]|uniref:type III secretion system inner membrane ring lipoprotein SctJ n=1 Tax=Burkholderia ubonensis TaxID=101571 RepID=UPI000B506CBD|nr:type III secretion inner membrane ring lipoprotein SctJ [Burkholderia ubonensis]